MKELIFDYLTDFKCIASECKHNCCIGWEIDIDKTTLSRYRKDVTAFSSELKKGINFGARCFKMAENRCCFLDKDNLCIIIKNMGEDSLCQVCKDHPRFRSFIGNTVETGLGLCCEEACKIVLSKSQPAKLITIKDDKESFTPFERQKLVYRQNLIDVCTCRENTLDNRVNILQSYCTENIINKSGQYFYDILVNLERYDKKWDDVLQFLLKNDTKSVQFDIPFENLLAYFIFRYVSRAKKDGLITALEFCLFSFTVIKLLCEGKNAESGCDFYDLSEFSRMFSCEIEYSDDNTNKILNKLKYKR